MSLAKFLFENSPWNPFWSAFLVGFCVVAADGKVYRTAAGQQYLDSLE